LTHSKLERPYRILVLTDTMPWGHRSIARAIYGHLARVDPEHHWQVHFTEVKADLGPAPELFTLMTRYFPETYSLAYKLSTQKITNQLLSDVSLNALGAMKEAVNQIEPDLIISTYFVHSHCLGRWKNSEGMPFKLWTVVSDPWSVSSLTFVPNGADLHLVYDKVGEKVGLDLGLAPSQILKTGWWVREEMYQHYDRAEARIKLGIRDNRPVVFVGGGSLGSSAIPRALPFLMASKKPLAVIINNGTDKVSLRMVDEYVNAYQLSKRELPVQVINLGWIENIAEVLAASDIVLGKAGPNFIFEVIAQRKPFVAISHIAGNEDGNLDLIRKAQLGWVREKPNKLRDFIKDYLQRPNEYHAMFRSSIAQEANRNRKSLPMIAEAIDALQRQQHGLLQRAE